MYGVGACRQEVEEVRGASITPLAFGLAKLMVLELQSCQIPPLGSGKRKS